MRVLELQEQKLDALFAEISKFDEDEIKSHLAKYLCIQASGYLENVIKELIADYHDGSCKKETEKYVNNKIKNFTSINEKKLKSLLKSFNETWEYKFQNSISDKELASLNSIISQRHLIAHGNGSGSNISYGNMVKYYQDLKQIVVLLRQIIK